MSEENTVESNWGLKCPKCKDDESLEIKASQWRGLVPDGTEDCDVDAGYEWEDWSDMRCSNCGHEGFVADFLAEPWQVRVPAVKQPTEKQKLLAVSLAAVPDILGFPDPGLVAIAKKVSLMLALHESDEEAITALGVAMITLSRRMAGGIPMPPQAVELLGGAAVTYNGLARVMSAVEGLHEASVVKAWREQAEAGWQSGSPLHQVLCVNGHRFGQAVRGFMETIRLELSEEAGGSE